ncbi:hypothetical protein IFM89_012856 [Coptis chinensis]|uniref:Uncharacterized protein n=1 Tax=Coptis chinensis TaxID=261450 RepID=A0A835HGK7_9MAGN|nr:hypothetical protein IFM89_012219 [Coptis chinensis]KAF9596657.1 hypothetical protein IFM89_012856 [Coptis chinensis]
MARQQLITAISLLLLSSAFAFVKGFEESSSEENKVGVVVEGMVYCQSCKYYGTWSLTGAKPVPSAKVSVTCKDHKNRVSFYKAFPTNENGYFYGQLDGFKMNNCILDHPLQACVVRLLSSPDSNCSSISNINDGINGAPLRYENKRLFGKKYEAVVYSTGPLAFLPSRCY